MSRIAILTAASILALAPLSLAAAKGPPSKVTITGGNLTSTIEVTGSDLKPFDESGIWDNTPGEIRYSSSKSIPGETPYTVTVYTTPPGQTPQPFLWGDYYPANSTHPSVIAEVNTPDRGLFKLSPEFGALIDSHVAAATQPSRLPSAGGPSSATNASLYAILALGAVTALAASIFILRHFVIPGEA
jgi:hypothetical protein